MASLKDELEKRLNIEILNIKNEINGNVLSHIITIKNKGKDSG